MASRNNQAAHEAILATVIYSDIFNFPLTREEIWKYLICKKYISYKIYDKALETASHGDINLAGKEEYFCLKGREKIIALRQKYSNEVRKKLDIAKKAALYLSYIPSILFIGISGGLAIGNVDETSDIDFFIITKKNTLWTTRLWALALLEAVNLRRKRTDKKVANKICCNLLIEETKLSWDKRKQNIYSAHEIVQIKPLFERDNTYKYFLEANTWIQNYFPNFNYSHYEEQSNTTIHHRRYALNIIFTIINCFPVKIFVKFLQQKYMQKHKTTEIIENGFLAFHPHDYTERTIYLFNKGLKKHGIDKHIKINYTGI